MPIHGQLFAQPLLAQSFPRPHLAPSPRVLIPTPLVVRLDGNNVEEGRRILAEANHPLVIQAETMDAGADKAAELANK